MHVWYVDAGIEDTPEPVYTHCLVLSYQKSPFVVGFQMRLSMQCNNSKWSKLFDIRLHRDRVFVRWCQMCKPI